MTVDLAPLVNEVVLPLVTAVLSPLVPWLAYKAIQVLHLQLTKAQAATLEVAMQNGINYALGKVQAFTNAHGQVQMKDQVVAQAAAYVLPKVPDTLKALGVTPEGLKQRIEARLPPVPVPPDQ